MALYKLSRVVVLYYDPKYDFSKIRPRNCNSKCVVGWNLVILAKFNDFSKEIIHAGKGYGCDR